MEDAGFHFSLLSLQCLWNSQVGRRGGTLEGQWCRKTPTSLWPSWESVPLSITCDSKNDGLILWWMRGDGLGGSRLQGIRTQTLGPESV